MYSYLILVVIYKEKIDQAQSVVSLRKSASYLTKSTILIWDNSPTEQTMPEAYAEMFNKIIYRHTPQNRPLSHIYNYVIDNFGNYDFLTIFDQDSEFDERFFQELHEATSANKTIDLFLPIVRSQRNIVSPGSYYFVKGTYWTKRKFGVISTKNLVAINSGMTIRFSYLRRDFEGYNERLNFYGVDTHFMLEYAKKRAIAFILDYTIQHDSALLSNDEEIEKRISRFRDMWYSWKVIHEDSLLRSVLIRMYILYTSIKSATHFKSTAFLSAGLRSALSFGNHL